MPDAAVALDLADLGPSQRAAIRKLLTAFRSHGWRDVDGAAVAMIARLERAGGHASTRSVAAAAPSDFLAVNAATRAQLAQMLGALAGHTSSSARSKWD
jgi:hypothetical protein